MPEYLRWTQLLADIGAHHLAYFLSQHVVEKALNASLCANGKEVVLGRSVERLCAAAADFEPEFELGTRYWSILDGYYIPTRYPSGLPGGIPSDVYTHQASAKAVGLATGVFSSSPPS